MNKGALFALVLLGFFYMGNQRLPRGIRNNNPLNIRENGIQWQGAIGSDGDFVQFKSPQKGVRAASRILKVYRDKYGLDSITGIISRWAPPSENDTIAYIDSVSENIGVGRNESLTNDEYLLLIKAMIYHENGLQPYDNSVIETGFDEGFYS